MLSSMEGIRAGGGEEEASMVLEGDVCLLCSCFDFGWGAPCSTDDDVALTCYRVFLFNDHVRNVRPVIQPVRRSVS